MHGGPVAGKLPPRPNLEHLRHQAKALLAALKAGEQTAVEKFVEHLPEARGMAPAAVRAAGFRLADAQSVIARQTGFAGWPALSRHVQDLRALEGEWRFTSLEVEGSGMPAAMLRDSRLLIDGDRFRTESPEANYDGVFTIDVEQTPPHIDIEFVEGPEAGGVSHGIYELDGDRLTLCLGLVANAARPRTFATKAGSGQALERLERVTAARPLNVTGGSAKDTKDAKDTKELADPSSFEVEMTPLFERLQGEWIPVELFMDGKAMPSQCLAFGIRTMTGNEMKVVFGGQTMVHAKVRIDESVAPIAVDYLNLMKKQAGTITRGIMDWAGDEVRFLIAAPGDPRPKELTTSPPTGTYSRWRRK